MQQKQDLENQKSVLSEKIAILTEELSSIDELENSAMENKTTANKAISERQERYNTLREKRDGINAQMTTVKVEIALWNTKTIPKFTEFLICKFLIVRHKYNEMPNS